MNGRRINQRKRSSYRAVSQQKLTVDERVENGNGESMRNSAMSDALSALPLRACSQIVTLPTPNFHFIRAVCFLLRV